MEDDGLQKFIAILILALPYSGECLLRIPKVIHMVHQGSDIDHSTVDQGYGFFKTAWCVADGSWVMSLVSQESGISKG